MPEPTPRIQCHGKNEAKKLEGILNRIIKGAKVRQITQMGAIVYVDFE